MVTVKLLIGVLRVVETVSVDVAEPPATRIRLDGLKDSVGPKGATVAEREMEPVRLLRLFTVTVAAAD